ncbi:hypothetical protein F3Y22_tig00112416pilonHSYRG00027 [Hibiscus syriacus]|uniref:Uncharacterized protein n=1 Tax=Hibiscus syriacus TaxID=106335 RepID=A0A6A2XJK7_HIBSY|nr:hypothetical protein F3Y22_tig00112416pilonHSYRG00027 [Hibiscus syriacus]
MDLPCKAYSNTSDDEPEPKRKPVYHHHLPFRPSTRTKPEYPFPTLDLPKREDAHRTPIPGILISSPNQITQTYSFLGDQREDSDCGMLELAGWSMNTFEVWVQFLMLNSPLTGSNLYLQVMFLGVTSVKILLSFGTSLDRFHCLTRFMQKPTLALCKVPPM